MQLLYIIGNGFDLNLGLKTSYKDFYQYYSKLESNNLHIKKLKENISNSYESWSDLELALGNYTGYIEKKEEFDDIIINIGEELSKYLCLEEEKVERNVFDLQKFFNYLSFPENTFLLADKEKLMEYKKRWANHEWYVNIYTLNYTYIIEKILGENKKGSILATRRNNLLIRLGEVKHVHGCVDNDMVIGVYDISQIKNVSFHQDPDILESIVKSECNQANRNNVDRDFAHAINSANIICVFGSSIGETDRKWWEQIGERLKNDCYLMIFFKVDEIPSRTGYMKKRKERSLKMDFLSKTKLTEEEIEKAKEKIFIGLNTNMFGGLIKQVENRL